MKRILNNKMIKGIVGLICMTGLCVVLNGVSSSMTNELYHQVKSVEELKENFNQFNVIDSKNDEDLYVITLNNDITIAYEVYYDMFYVNDGGNIEEFEAIEDAQNYVDKILKNKYNDYKNSLIAQYGEDTYNLMNQEAGINSEEESFIHYAKYGI